MRFITRTFRVAGLALLAPAFLLAQHTGNKGHAGSAHAVEPGRSFGLPAPRVGTAPLGLSPQAAGYTGIRTGALRSYRIGRNYLRSYRHVPYAYFFAPYYYPFLDYASSAYPDYSYGYDLAADPNAQGESMAQNALGDQINRLTAEVDQLRYAQQQTMAPAPPPEQDPQPPSAPVTLVLRNGQQLRVQNYAVMDRMFWDFSAQPTQKIPIANIDIAASAKATMASGGEFPPLEPTASKGQ